MKKNSLFLLCLLMAPAYAGQNSLVIDDACIAKAHARVAAEVNQLRRTQLIRTGLTVAALGAIGAYSVYRWWTEPKPSTPVAKIEEKKPETSTGLPGAGSPGAGSPGAGSPGAGSPGAGAATVGVQPKIGYLRWIGSSIGNGVLSMTTFFATVALSSYALAAAQCSLAQVVNTLNKSYDWRWMTHERTQLYPLLWQLKCMAAMLDPQSSVFDGLKNVQVAITDHAMVNNQDGALSVMAFDELIRLRALTQKTADNNQRALAEQQLKAVWCLIVEAVTYDLGFIAYKEKEPVVGEIVPFDKHQLGAMRAQLLNQTNTLTDNLDQLLAHTSVTTSGGLLERVYNYCNTLSWACGVLENNGIVGQA